MTLLDVDQLDTLAQPHVRYVYFIEFHFASMVYRCSTLNVNVSWGGYEWVGMGSVGSFGSIERQQGTAAKAIEFELNLADTTFVALGAGPVEEYRGRTVNIYFCPLDEGFQLIGTPKICWRGTMDTMTGGVAGKKEDPAGSLRLRCETSSYGLKRPPALRLNAAQHKAIYPGDTALDRLTMLIAQPVPWLSVKFQRR